MITGLIASVLGAAIGVIADNDGPTKDRLTGANTTLAAANYFPADVMAAPPTVRPLGRDVATARAAARAASQHRGTNLINLTWAEQTGRLEHDVPGVVPLRRGGGGAAAGELLGPERVGALGQGRVSRVGALRVATNTTLTYSTLDADDITLVVDLATTPPSTVRIRGVRQNYPEFLEAPPLATPTAAIQLVTSTETLQYARRATSSSSRCSS